MAEINQAGNEVRVNMTEARQRLTDLVEMVATGTTVFLMRRGVPIAEIVAVKPPSVSFEATPEEHARAREIAEEQGLVEVRAVAQQTWKPAPSLAQTQARQAGIDSILNNLGGKKKGKGG